MGGSFRYSPHRAFLSGIISTMSSLPSNWPDLFSLFFLLKTDLKKQSSIAQPFPDYR